jgi:hypothetical protein
MKESKVLYGFKNGYDCIGLVWETELGKIITVEGKLDLTCDLQIRDINGKDLGDVDLRNVLMSILPTI